MVRRLASLGTLAGVLALVGAAFLFVGSLQPSAAAATLGAAPPMAAGPQDQQAPVVRARAAGDLDVTQLSIQQFGLYAGHPFSITLYYSWRGDEAAPNAVLTEELPPQFVVSSTTPAHTSQSGSTLTWNLGSLAPNGFGTITIEGSVPASIADGTVVTATARLTADVDDPEPEDNTSQIQFTVREPKPNLFLWKFGLLEELENGSFFEAEQGSEISFDIYYGNFSLIAATNAVLTDTLPAGVEYLSAVPAPSSVNGSQLTWQLGTVNGFDFGEIKVNVRPNVTGTLINRAGINASGGVSETSSFQFTSVALSQPRLLKPSTKNRGADDPIIIAPSSAFRGLAKAGATVTIYRGSPDGCFGFSGCNATALMSTTVNADRTWTITPTTPLTNGLHYLYFRASKDGQQSNPTFSFWEPLAVNVDGRFEQAGWDVDNFVIGSGGQEQRPGAIGGSSGTTPNEDLTIKIRSKAPPTITNATYWAPHDLLLVDASSGERITETLRVSRVDPVTSTTSSAQRARATGTVRASEHWSSWDFIYVHKGFGPGSKIEIWCLPVFYTDEGLPIVGLVYVKCHEILVDPAGYVYDREKAGRDIPWPEKPDDKYLIPNATVTVTVRQGDNSFVPWNAAATGQVNPQFTDSSATDRINVPGYFAFYVPSGQYKLFASAPGCVSFESPILTVVETPVFYNVGMRCTASAAGRITYTTALPALIIGPG